MVDKDSWIYGAWLIGGIVFLALLGLALLVVGIIGFIAMPWDCLTLPVTTEWLARRSLINAFAQFAVSLVSVILGGIIAGGVIYGWFASK